MSYSTEMQSMGRLCNVPSLASRTQLSAAPSAVDKSLCRAIEHFFIFFSFIFFIPSVFPFLFKIIFFSFFSFFFFLLKTDCRPVYLPLVRHVTSARCVDVHLFHIPKNPGHVKGICSDYVACAVAQAARQRYLKAVRLLTVVRILTISCRLTGCEPGAKKANVYLDAERLPTVMSNVRTRRLMKLPMLTTINHHNPDPELFPTAI